MAELDKNTQNEVLYCTNCGKKLIPNSKFCKYCGYANESANDNDSNKDDLKNKSSEKAKIDSKSDLVADNSEPPKQKITSDKKLNNSSDDTEENSGNNKSKKLDSYLNLNKVKNFLSDKKIPLILLGMLIVICVVVFGLIYGCNDKKEEVNNNMPKYEINLIFECKPNLFLSKYDIDVFVDNNKITTVNHGCTDEYKGKFTEGTHKIEFRKKDSDSPSAERDLEVNIINKDKIKYSLSCKNDKIEVEQKILTKEELDKINQEQQKNAQPNAEDSNQGNAQNEQSKSDQTKENNDVIYNISNCPELAYILSLKNTSDPAIASFALNYRGKKIEFDGNIGAFSNFKNYKTRYNFIINAGDYNPNSSIGPEFQLYNTDMTFSNSDLRVGDNIHLIAEVDSFESTTDLFRLKPIKAYKR